MIHPVPRKALVFPALAAAGLLAVLPAPLRPVDPKTAQKIDAAVEKVKPDVVKVRRFLHMNPELANREVETAKLVASKLESLGLEVRTGVAKTGVVAVLRGAQPGAAVAVRADMDALPIQEATGLPYKSLNPGVMHACGHDVHTSIALGTAMVLATLKDHIKGSVTFIFQPSEEGAPENEEGGADVMVREGALENPTVGAIFALHVWPEDVGQVYFSPGNVTAAADYFWITVKGKSSHGARPQEGVDAIVMAAEIVQALQTIVSRATDPTDPAVVTVGTIQGGTKANIIADSVLLGGTVRTMSEANRRKVPALLEAVVKNITEIYGGSYEFDYKPRVSSVYNNPELAAAMTPTLVRILGRDKVLEWKPQMIAEDFSAFSQRIPGFYFFLGVKNPAQAAMAPLHSPTFAPDERSIPLGMRLLANLLLDALEVQDSLVSGTPKI